jgi:hypothetical protein
MSTVTRTRTVVVVGTRPRLAPVDVLGDVPPGGAATVFVLGLDPTPGQRRFADEALAMADERGIVLTAELIPAPSWLAERLRGGDVVRIVARTGEARRWKLEPGPVLSPRDA